jgi:hypothetical protein
MKKLLIKIAVMMIGIQTANAVASEAINAQRVTVFGEYLNWYASEQTDAVWANDIGFPATNHVTYSTPNLKFNWSSGFRGGIGYAFPQFWDVTLAWTHMPTSKSVSYSAAAFHILTPEFFSGFLSSDTFSSASINWKIAMNTVDLAISHAFNASKSLLIRPAIGVKAATINQTINTDWNATLFSFPLYTSTEKVTNNFTGIGPELGINGIWNFYQNFSLVGDVSTALMWGRWNVRDTYSRPSALSGLVKATTINTSMTNSKLGTPMYQAFLGLQWVYESTYQVKFLLGYEMQYWANQLRVPTFQLLPLHGDLTLQGGTCGISISF